MMRLLVTAISGNVATGVLHSLSEYEYHLFGCDVGKYPAGIDLVEDFFCVPYAQDKKYIPELILACKARQIQAILPTNETELAILDKQRAKFAEADIKLIMNDSYILNTCLDKYICIQELKKLGIDVPQTYFTKDLPDGFGDYILKPRSGCGSKFLKRANNADEVRQIEEEFGKSLIIQEYLPDEAGEYTMGVFSDGKMTRCIIFQRELTHGYTSFVKLVHDEAMESIGETIAKSWHLCGSINIQMRQKNGKAYVFEINPRLSGTTHFRSLVGFNDAYWWCRMAFGQSIPRYKSKFKEAIGVRMMDEKIISVQ